MPLRNISDIREKGGGLEIKRLNMYKQESRMEQRNYELTNQLHREQIALETQKQYLHDQQQILNLNLRQEENKVYNLQRENKQLMNYLRDRPGTLTNDLS